MSAGSNEMQTSYQTVINHEGQYSIWPADKPLPKGWSAVGPKGSKDICLAYIGEQWTDMRPRSLRESAAHG